MRRVVLASGGMDSFLAWALFAQDAVNLFVDIDHKYREKERNALDKLTALVPDFQIQVVVSSDIGRTETASGIIPLRNAQFILAAAPFADEIIMGILQGEINSDKSEHFISLMQQVLNESWKEQYWTEGRIFTIATPTRAYSKTELIHIYAARKLPIEWLAATVSCYADDDLHCGECPSCAKRWIALKNNNLQDIHEWRKDPRQYIAVGDESILTKAATGQYDSLRAVEIMTAMEGYPV